jgi:alpha-L-rhamnosidase
MPAVKVMSSHRQPAGLLCDLLVRPEHGLIATREPTFGWIPAGQSGMQAAYQINVADDRNALCTGRVLRWDSGRVASAQSLHIPYAGDPLAWGTSACWTVRTWDATGVESDWAEPQCFQLAPEQPAESMSVHRLETRRLEPVDVSLISAGTWLADFGREAFGWLELTVENPVAGEVVLLRVGEALQDGRLNRVPGGSIRYEEARVVLEAGRKCYRVGMKPGVLNHRPVAIKLPGEFPGVMPFRYVEIEADGQSGQARVEQVRLQYPFDEHAASFHSSSSELDEIWEFCRYSMLATSFAGYYVDGDRERIPYEADVYINQLSHYAVDREFSLARRTHEYLLRNPTWPTEWKQHSILVAWADYEATGDARSLERCYGILRDEKLLLQHARADGLLDSRELRDIVDWPVGERDDYDFRPINTVVNAFHYRTLVLMARIAGVLGRGEDAADFDHKAGVVAKAFNAVLWDDRAGLYIDGEGSRHASIHANLFALAFDLVPAERRHSVVAELKRRGMACSVYPAQFLLEGLFKAGEAEHAIGLMVSDSLRSWRNMLAKGATVTWEAWDQTLKPNQDWNHAWGAAPGNIIARYVLGVRPLEPGYGRVLVEPQLGGLTEVSGVVPTIRGPICVRAWQTSDGTHFEVKAPPNVMVETVGFGAEAPLQAVVSV